MKLDPAWVINHTCRKRYNNKLYYYIYKKEKTLKNIHYIININEGACTKIPTLLGPEEN